MDGAAATARLALLLPADAWAEHRRWRALGKEAAQLWLYLRPLGSTEGSYLQRLQSELAGLREPPPGADPFR